MAVTLNANTSTGFIATSDTSGVLQLQTAGTTAVTVDASQNVGIGTASPATSLYKLTLAGDAGAGSGVQIRSDSGTGAFSRIAFTRDSTDATTGLIRYSNSDYSMQFFTANGTTNGERMRLNSTGALVLAGGSTSANGIGIAFPATQSASSDANTLDDYEEGTWTGTIKGSTTDPTTPVTATGTYTKIGRQVFARISFGPVSTVGAAGDFYISGLPFSTAQALATGNTMTFSIISFPSAGNLTPYVSGTSVYIYYMVTAAGWAASTHNAGTTRYLELSVTYNV